MPSVRDVEETTARSRAERRAPDATPAHALAAWSPALPRAALGGVRRLGAAHVAALQRAVGNRAVAGLVAARAAARGVQRMPYVNNAVDGAPVSYELARGLASGWITNAEIQQLMDPGGIGSTTIRQLGASRVLDLKRRMPVAQLIGIVTQLNRPEIDRLFYCEEQFGLPAAAFTQFVARPVADLATLLAPIPGGRDHPDIVSIAHGLGLAVPALDVHQLASLPPAISAAEVVTIANGLNPLPAAQKVQLATALHADGLNGQRIAALVTSLVNAGRNGLQIQAAIDKLRGNLQAPASPLAPEARTVTSVPAIATVPTPPPVQTPLAGPVVPPAAPVHAVAAPLLPAQQPGGKVLSGPEIESHLQATVAAGRAAPTIEDSYPTGQLFTPGSRTDLQLWDDLKVNAAGAYFLPNMNPASPGETPAQRQIRQKLALRELMRRYPARASVIQSIFAHDEGATPRPFTSIAFEDTYNVNAHNTSRHVLGGANMQNLNSLAWRAITKVPHCGAVATAFNTVGEANGAVAGALAGAGFFTAAYWQTFRDNLANAVLPAQILQPSNVGVALRKTDAPRAQPYAMPLGPLDSARPLIDPGPPVAIGAPGPAAGAPSGLTHRLLINSVIVRLQPSDNQAGKGWCVYTTYPQP
jgi:hypothetical protein